MNTLKIFRNDNKTYFSESETNNVWPSFLQSPSYIFRIPNTVTSLFLIKFEILIFLQPIFHKFFGLMRLIFKP